MESIKSPATFVEDQRFNQVWLWATLIGADFYAAGIGYIAINSPKTPASSALPIAVIIGVVMALPMIMMALCKLHVEVCSENISLRFFPFHSTPRIYPMSSIRSAEATAYSPIRDYGGWGLRRNRAGEKIYNTSGNKGVQLTFEDGKKMIIGSQQAEKLAQEISVFIRRG